jgi:hypothetical protein
MNKLSLLFNKPKGRFCEDAVCCRIELVTSFLRRTSNFLHNLRSSRSCCCRGRRRCRAGLFPNSEPVEAEFLAEFLDGADHLAAGDSAVERRRVGVC